MLVARRGRLDDAARVFAYANNVYARRGIRPRAISRQIKDRLLALLAVDIPSNKLEQLFEEGRRLTEGAACAMVFPNVAAEPQSSAKLRIADTPNLEMTPYPERAASS